MVINHDVLLWNGDIIVMYMKSLYFYRNSDTIQRNHTLVTLLLNNCLVIRHNLSMRGSDIIVIYRMSETIEDCPIEF